MKITNFLATAFVFVLLLGALWLWFMPTSLNKAPEISLPIIDGRKIDLQELQGQPVLVTFWSTTCSGCLKEMPHLVELYEEFAPQGLEIIGIAMYYDPPNQVLNMSKHRNIPYPIALDIKGQAAQAFGNVTQFASENLSCLFSCPQLSFVYGATEFVCLPKFLVTFSNESVISCFPWMCLDLTFNAEAPTSFLSRHQVFSAKRLKSFGNFCMNRGSMQGWIVPLQNRSG